MKGCVSEKIVAEAIELFLNARGRGVQISWYLVFFESVRDLTFNFEQKV